MASSAVLTRPLPGPIWRLSPELAAVWPRDESWPIPAWLEMGCARIVKKGPQRTVVRVDLPELSFYIKHHHLPDRVTWLRQCLRGPKGRREFDRLTELTKRDVPTPAPLGWGARPGWGGVGESFVITRAIDDVTPLNRMFVHERFEPARRQAIAAALGRFVARLHRAGVDHTDLHLGNIVAQPTDAGGFDLFLVDLDAVRLGPPLDRRRSLANLALLGNGIFATTHRADRLRFLRHYVAERGWFDPARDVGGARELFDLARAIERAAWDHSFTFWADRDERCLESNRYYQRVRHGSLVGMATRDVDSEWLVRLCRDPDALLRDAGATILKHSKTSTVAEIAATIDGQRRPVILKKIGVTRWSDPWAALVRPTPILRSWISGQGFLERNLPTPRPLAMLHRRQSGLPHDGYLVTEKLDDVQELDKYVEGLSDLSSDVRRRRLRDQIDRVARAVRAMHSRRISHRDLKAANMLVTSLAVEETAAGAPRPIIASPFPVIATNLWFIDLVGVSIHKRLGKRRRVQNLARLNASFLRSNAVTRTDRLRFLRVYLAWGIHGKGRWKEWWRAIADATAAKAARNQKSGRVLG